MEINLVSMPDTKRMGGIIIRAPYCLSNSRPRACWTGSGVLIGDGAECACLNPMTFVLVTKRVGLQFERASELQGYR
jgi:hypothetical protein